MSKIENWLFYYPLGLFLAFGFSGAIYMLLTHGHL